MLAVTAHQVSGIVVDEAGSPQAGVTLTLMGGPGVGPVPPAMARTDQAGAFNFGGVVAGTYRVTAMIPTSVKVAYELGSIPCARCSPDNVPSRKTLQKAGFVPYAHILNGSIPAP